MESRSQASCGFVGETTLLKVGIFFFVLFYIFQIFCSECLIRGSKHIMIIFCSSAQNPTISSNLSKLIAFISNHPFIQSPWIGLLIICIYSLLPISALFLPLLPFPFLFLFTPLRSLSASVQKINKITQVLMKTF